MNDTGTERPIRLLIVDDSGADRLLLHAFLDEAGYHEIQTVASARAVFRLLGMPQPEPGLVLPDLILMDHHLGGIDGIEACRRIKAVAPLAGIPIIIVTGNAQEQALKDAFEAGATDYITKPVNKVELLARVGSVLALKQEMDQRKARERDLKKRTEELEAALQEVKTLRGCLPMCPACKKIRDDRGYWNQVEVYLEAHSDAEVSSSLCPQCMMKMYDENGRQSGNRRTAEAKRTDGSGTSPDVVPASFPVGAAPGGVGLARCRGGSHTPLVFRDHVGVQSFRLRASGHRAANSSVGTNEARAR